MIEVLILYCIFAVSTAATLTYYIFWQLLRAAKSAGVRNDLIRSPIISCVTYMLISTLMAPIGVLVILFPSVYDKFRAGTYRVLYEDDKI